MAHAAANVGALVLYSASLLARRRGAQGTGVALGLAGAAALGAGGWLGGDLAYALGLGVDQTVFHPEPSDWTPVLDASMLVDDRPTAATAGNTPVMVVRRNGTLHALADRCTHRGGPLSEGELVGDCVQCPWHQSRFRLDDGSVEQGPATFPQPVLDVREHDGRIEIRRR
jgi:nitrite reductase/ring-hydroxylating ferredoxin subunit